MNSREKYDFWIESSYIDSNTKDELIKIKDNEKEIEERFYRELEFGTGGMRGILGAGTNRMNIYTIRKASQGLAQYIIKKVSNSRSRGIAIAYDSRHLSREFAFESAGVFAANGIKSYVFEELRPTPELSFTVRELNCAGGIVITASHNPKDYNGLKVYGEDGAQLNIEASDMVLEEFNGIEDITGIKTITIEKAIEMGLIKIIGAEIDDIYIERLKELAINPDIMRQQGESFKMVFTPLNGAGSIPVKRILKECGLKNILVVREQEQPDPDFTTVPYPNPEDPKAFTLAISLAEQNDVDLILGTDPDCDRLGIIVRNDKGEYVPLTGNQTGCLLLEYLLSQKKEKGLLNEQSLVISTIVSTRLTSAICKYYGVKLENVLTGFKFIGEKVKELDEDGDYNFVFGFEESYGYLAGNFVRDKDGVVAAMLTCEMASFYRSNGMNLFNALNALYKKYGYFIEENISYTLKGKEGLEKIAQTMDELRNKKPILIDDFKIKAVSDYLKGEKKDCTTSCINTLNLPKSNVICYDMEDESWLCIRPSGTEPKIKVYMGTMDENQEKAASKLEKLKYNVKKYIEKLLDI